MTKTNAAAIADTAPAASVTEGNRPAFASSANLAIDDAKSCISSAMEMICAALTLNVNIPDPNGDHLVEVASDDQTGEVEEVRCRVANRFGRDRQQMLNQVMRQFDYAIGNHEKNIADLQRDVSQMMSRLNRSEDANKIRDAIEGKLAYADVEADRVAWLTALQDSAHETYLDLIGNPYVPYDAKAPRKVTIAAPSADVDPLLARAAAFAAKR